MHGRAEPEERYASGEVMVERGGAAQVPEVLAMLQGCADAPHWPADAWQAYVHGGESGAHNLLLVARGSQGELLGWLAASGVFEVAELEFVLVDPAARGRGVGRALVQFWLRQLEEAGAREALLEVRPSNVAAVRLYEALGFEVQGVRRGYYAEPREDALLMRRVLREDGGSGR